jgi:hypothetical protein
MSPAAIMDSGSRTKPVYIIYFKKKIWKQYNDQSIKFINYTQQYLYK